MTTPSIPKTIRLINTASGNMQLNLHLAIPHFRVGHRSMRRGVMMHPICIMPQRFYDVCQELGVTFDEAQAVLHASPEVRAHESSQRLRVLVYPPLDESTQPVQTSPSEKVSPSENTPPPADAASEPEESLDEEQPSVETTSVASSTEPIDDMKKKPSLLTPSAAWTMHDLQVYARQRGIEGVENMSKSVLLRAIRLTRESE